MIVVYAKWKGGDGKFHAFDLENGVPSGNIINASTYRDDQLKLASEEMQKLCDKYAHIDFKVQLRADDNKKVLWESA